MQSLSWKMLSFRILNTLVIQQTLGITKNLFGLLKNKTCKNILFCISYLHWCSEMNIGETWSILLPSTWLKVSSTKKKQIVNIVRARVYLARSLFHKQCNFNCTFCTLKSIKYSKALIWVVMQRFITMDPNVNSNLHKILYKKLKKYKIHRRQRLFSISLSFYQTNLQSSPQSRYMFNIQKLLLIDALKFIPGETRDLLRIAIDLLEGQ